MNSYEEPGKKLYAHTWSEEYKNNYDCIFGSKEKVIVKISYLNGDVVVKVFLTEADLQEYLKQNDSTIVNMVYME